MYRYGFYPYDMINRRLFETIFECFGKTINNISFFYEVGLPPDVAFVKLFKGRLVNIIDCRRVSTWPGTDSLYPGAAEAISCLYGKRLKKVFLTKIAPFLFDSFDQEIDVAAVKLRLQNVDETDDDEMDEEAVAEWLQRDHFNEWLDVSVVANDGFPLFYTTAHEKYATLLVPNDAWTLFLSKLQVDESFFEEVGDVDFDEWKTARYYTFDKRERGFYD